MPEAQLDGLPLLASPAPNCALGHPEQAQADAHVLVGYDKGHGKTLSVYQMWE